MWSVGTLLDVDLPFGGVRDRRVAVLPVEVVSGVRDPYVHRAYRHPPGRFARLLCALSWADADCADKEVVLPIVDLLWRSL